ncbi:MAG: anti-sigma factor antagonist [Oscillospiraceae bacterium]
MKIHYHPETGVLHIRLDGEIDHHSSSFMRSEIDDAIYAYLPEMLVLDFGDVSFMDSSGIGLIMGRYKIISPLGSDLLIANPSPHISRILKLAGMERLAKIQNFSQKENQ